MTEQTGATGHFEFRCDTAKHVACVLAWCRRNPDACVTIRALGAEAARQLSVGIRMDSFRELGGMGQ